MESFNSLLFRVCVCVCRRDTESVFSEAVTDDIAPNYSSIITQPVDLAIMAERIENNHYPSVNEFKVHVLLLSVMTITRLFNTIMFA